MQATYEYYWWSSQGGRLYRIKSGTPYASQPDPTKFQDLYYNYDLVGNILHIYDYKAGPQTQTFSYDALYRLTGAIATGGGGGDGNYDESAANNLGYEYSTSNGNPSQAQGKLWQRSAA